MKSDIIDEFIENICDGECTEYFLSSKKRAIKQIKTTISSEIFSKNLNRELEIEIAKIASTIIKKINTIDKNRFWVIYYRLAEKLISLKCNECKSSNQILMCEEYILDRIMQYIKKFDIDVESTPFQEVREFIEKGDYEQKRAGVAGNYIRKIFKRYNQKSIDSDTANALIENAMVAIDKEVIPQKDFSEKIILKNEISKRLKHDQGKISTLLYSLLMELLYEEKFFNYANNHVIPKRFIDFIRYWKFRDNESTPTESTLTPIEEVKLEEILADYLDIIPEDTKLILRLKIGERLNNRDFIKVAYLFDYREIDIFENFTDEENLAIKFYARNNIEFLAEIDKKISEVREKLEANSYIDIEDDKKRVTLLKLIFSEEMKAKEIGMLLGYSDKQVNKKIENIKKKINKRKESALCKEM